MTPWFRLRASEWILVSFFAYVAVVSHWFPARPNLHHQPLVILGIIAAFSGILARLESGAAGRVVSSFRDFIPSLVMILGFREMEYFLPSDFDHHLENVWIVWDRFLLENWHLRAAIEKLGWLLPSYLEFCYLLVYGLPFYCTGVLYFQDRREKVDLFFSVYLTGTLIAYGLFPFFPSQPPRFLFPDTASPHVTTFLRSVNVEILRGATIHVGVFPSAHVSSAFSAAWAMFLIFPRKKLFGWTLLIYAVSVSIATIYGRYHYTTDVLAGFGVSLIAGLAALAVHFLSKQPGSGLLTPQSRASVSRISEEAY